MTRDDVIRAMGGDRDAFARLVAATHSTVSSITLAITRDPETSDDTTQDVFLAAWLGMRRLRNPDSFLPWLRQVARHVARSALRTRRRRARWHLPAADAEALLPRVVDPASDADAALLDAERRASVAAALDALPDDARDCVILYYREGESAERVAALLGVPSPTVRKRLERARRRLRADLMSRFGQEVKGLSGRNSVAAIVAALGSAPTDASAALAAGVGKAAAPAVPAGHALGAVGAAIGGAALGVASDIVRAKRTASRLSASPRVARRFVAGVAAGSIVIGAILPLAYPRALAVWFVVAQLLVGWLTFRWLPRHGVPATRGAIGRWLLAGAMGTVAVWWALRQMG